MNKRILIDANFPTETRVVVLDKNGQVDAFEYESDFKRQIKGNIYLAKITRVEPSLQAAFVDFGDEKSGFLPFSEIHPDYYNIAEKHRPEDEIGGSSEVSAPEIGKSDNRNDAKKLAVDELLAKDEIDIDMIEKMVEDKAESDFDIEADESDVERIGRGRDRKSEADIYKIQEVIKKGQIMLLQVTKEERGNKGASLTSYISLAGKYCVLMPNKPDQHGISRKISNSDERKRLKNIISELASSNDNKKASVILRTAGAGHTSIEIKKDFEYLARLWNRIREVTLKSKAPCFIHEEDGVILKTIRDLMDKHVKEVLVQGAAAFTEAQKFVRDMMPSEKGAVKEYRSKTPIFTKYNIEDQLTKLYQTNVYLPSGGYIVINPTEALTSIDVNSGRSTSERNIEEMALKTNLEAAREIARQAKLRDLSGLLVLDFIDMMQAKNRKTLERAFREFLSKDRARIQTAQISTFGLLEMSRQRLRPTFLEVNSTMCPHCSGKGVVRGDEANSMLILRTIENEIHNGTYDVVNVYGVASSIMYLLNNKREEINFIEYKNNIKLNFYIDNDATSDSYSIEKVKLTDKQKKAAPLKKPILQDTSEIYADAAASTGGNRKKINKRSSKFDKQISDDKKEEKSNSDANKDKKEKKIEQETKQDSDTDTKAEKAESKDPDSKSERPKKNRTRSKRAAKKEDKKNADQQESPEEKNKPVDANKNEAKDSDDDFSSGGSGKDEKEAQAAVKKTGRKKIVKKATPWKGKAKKDESKSEANDEQTVVKSEPSEEVSENPSMFKGFIEKIVS